MDYLDFRNKCEGCRFSRSGGGCSMEHRDYREYESNETLGNLNCKGRGINPQIKKGEELQKERQFRSYEEYKRELDTELGKTAEGFVRIGYLLKLARDTSILTESPYSNVVDFARAEYGIDKTQVSRFIHINDRFSEGGYSDRLKEGYRGFGYAKLAIMLQLPDTVNEELSPGYSKAEIQTLKEEVDREREITDIEVVLEGEEESMANLDDILCKVIRQLGEDEPELYVQIHHTARENGWSIGMLKEIMAPAGEKIYSVRVRGTGRMMLSLKDTERDVVLINTRDNEKNIYTWEDILTDWQRFSDTEKEDAEKQWESTYGAEFPKKEEVAPVQQKADEKKPTAKKEMKVSRAKTEKKKQEKGTGNHKDRDTAAGQQEELPGQTSLEKDFPEYMPDGQESGAALEGAGEDVKETEKPRMSDSEIRRRRKGYRELIEEEISQLRKCVEIRIYEAAKKSTFEINKLIDELAGLPKEEEDEE